jgi:membrane protease subunit (stomatin/prohibitin family)
LGGGNRAFDGRAAQAIDARRQGCAVRLSSALNATRSQVEAAMSLMGFIKKQFIDVIEWQEPGDGILAWRYPMQDNEIQNGARLTVRESQAALFVNEGRAADAFGPGLYTLNTHTLPLLTNLMNWDKLFASPFKSDVYFFSTRLQVDQRWGTPQPVTLRDKDFGAIRIRAFGNYSWRVADPKLFQQQVSGTRGTYTVDEIDGQLRGLMLQHLSDAVAQSGIPFLDLAANQVEFATQIKTAVAPAFANLGLALDAVTVQNVSLPDELQKILDQKIGMGMVGQNMGAFMQYQTAQSIPTLAQAAGDGGGGIAGSAVGLGAGVALGQVLAGNLAQGLGTGIATAAAASGEHPPVQDVMALIEKLGELKAKGILTEDEFAAKKTELLKKL